LIFDSWFDKYRGAVVLIYVQDGYVKEGDIITTVYSQTSYTVKNVGILRPTEFNTGTLYEYKFHKIYFKLIFKIL